MAWKSLFTLLSLLTVSLLPAVAWWKRAVDGDPDFAMARRNLGIAYAHGWGGGNLETSARELEKAVETSQDYPLHFHELDQVYEALGRSPSQRLVRLEGSRAAVEQGVQSLSRLISLKILAGQLDEAIELISAHRFDVWEGGTSTAADDWTNAHLLRGRRHLAAGNAGAALDDFRTAAEHPENLPSEARGSELRRPEFLYWKAVAFEALGETASARQVWEEAAEAAPYRSRRISDTITPRHVQDYYRALSLRRLGRSDEAERLLRGLVEAADAASDDLSTKDPQTVDEMTRARSGSALRHYVAALGYRGLGEENRARAAAASALEVAPDHLGATILLDEIAGTAAAER